MRPGISQAESAPLAAVLIVLGLPRTAGLLYTAHARSTSSSMSRLKPASTIGLSNHMYAYSHSYTRTQ